MMRLLTVLIFLCTLLPGCGTRVIKEGWKKKIDSEEISRIVLYFSAKLKKEKCLELEDSKVCYDDKIEYIYLKYSSMDLITMCEARLLLVELVEEFLERINQNSLIKFQTLNRPFTADDLKIEINFESFYATYIDPLYIGLISMDNGMVTYYAANIRILLNDWSDQRIEPYFKSRELALIKKEADAAYSVPPVDNSHSRILGNEMMQ